MLGARIAGDAPEWLPTLLTAVFAYATVVGLLRVSGKRTLSSWNSFDFVVTVAFGSTLATVILTPEVSVVRGAIAFATLIGLQYVVTWLSVRWETMLKIVKARPTLLVHRGEYRTAAMKRTRVNRAEILAALRAQGVPHLHADVSVVLETDGAFSVVVGVDPTLDSTLDGVEGYGRSQGRVVGASTRAGGGSSAGEAPPPDDS